MTEEQFLKLLALEFYKLALAETRTEHRMANADLRKSLWKEAWSDAQQFSGNVSNS